MAGAAAIALTLSAVSYRMLKSYKRVSEQKTDGLPLVLQHADLTQIELQKILKESLANKKCIIVRNVPGASEVVER